MERKPDRAGHRRSGRGRRVARPDLHLVTAQEQLDAGAQARDAGTEDDDGYFWIMGRVDDVLNVAGHRLSTMEIESALVHHPKVAEAAVVGQPDEIKGEGIACFVTLVTGHAPSDELKKELREHVAKEIGALARPDTIRFTDALPKTRSGKIMRRLLRSIARGEEITQDVSTLENPAILEQLKQST